MLIEIYKIVYQKKKNSGKSYSSLWIYCLRQQWWSETDSETDDQQFSNTIIYKGKSLNPV